jgi:hypothetical protein
MIAISAAKVALVVAVALFARLYLRQPDQLQRIN